MLAVWGCGPREVVVERELTVAVAGPRSIALALEVDAPPARVFEVLSTTLGLRSFWTEDCAVGATRARFGFARTAAQLEASVELEADHLVRMRVISGFPFWEGSTWEWELTPGEDDESTSVLFRHYGFGSGYAEVDCAHTAQTWAMILERLAGYLATGEAQPLFPAAAAADRA
jgi:uncharacterized protein YndB with AHSA1/START domain